MSDPAAILRYVEWWLNMYVPTHRTPNADRDRVYLGLTKRQIRPAYREIRATGRWPWRQRAGEHTNVAHVEAWLLANVPTDQRPVAAVVAEALGMDQLCVKHAFQTIRKGGRWHWPKLASNEAMSVAREQAPANQRPPDYEPDAAEIEAECRMLRPAPAAPPRHVPTWTPSQPWDWQAEQRWRHRWVKDVVLSIRLSASTPARQWVRVKPWKRQESREVQSCLS